MLWESNVFYSVSEWSGELGILEEPSVLGFGCCADDGWENGAYGMNRFIDSTGIVMVSEVSAIYPPTLDLA